MDETIRLWNANTGTHIRTIIGHMSDVNSVAFSPDGNTLASGSYDDAVRLWDVSSGGHLRTLTGHIGSVESIAFSRDGQMLASGSYDGTVRLWNAHTRQHIATLKGHTESVSSVVFSPDGRTLASGSYDGTVRLWNANTGTHLRTLTRNTGQWVWSVAFSPDGKTLASGGVFKPIRLWDANTGKHIRLIGNGDVYSVSHVVFSPDGQTLASLGSSTLIEGTDRTEGTIHLWDVQTGQHIRILTAGYVIGDDKQKSSVVAFSPDGNTIASGSEDGTVLLWNIAPSPTSTATVSLSPTTVQSPAVGKQLAFSINITDGENVAGYQAIVEFDTTALKYVKSGNGDYLSAGAYVVPATVDGSAVTLAATSLASESSGDGTLATITFEVVAVTTSSVALSEVLLTDRAGGSYTPRTENTEITEPQQLPEDVNDDGVVNIIDLTVVASNFGKNGQNDADVNGDGVVNIVDLTLVAAAFGSTASAPFGLGRDSEHIPTRQQVQQWLREAENLKFTTSKFQRGIAVLEQLLAAITPEKTLLLPNYPNPFNPETWIPYQLAKPTEVSISIYTANGQLVRTLALGHQPVGIYESRSHAAYWDGTNTLGEPVASGVYFYTLTAGEFTATGKMLIRK